ncbi:hypothetical protein AHF37_05546, partial [Paragonimus kellicotti]
SCAQRIEPEFLYFLLDYRIHTHPVISLQEDNDDYSGADSSDYDEKKIYELQTDFVTNWVPKLTDLHPEHPLAVQLNTDKLGFKTRVDSNDVTFDVFYNGTAHNDNPVFLMEHVISINKLRRTPIYSREKSYIKFFKGNRLFCMIFIINTRNGI